ncbi:MAG: hypothetical protein JW940_17050 [Polyangiaceae bacterium]|nr:hypothetical protein [Polyangiaceae bacterium]
MKRGRWALAIAIAGLAGIAGCSGKGAEEQTVAAHQALDGSPVLPGGLTVSGGSRIISDSSVNGAFAFNAYGGAAEGGQVLLSQDCPKDNPDCMWTYRRGMLVSASNTSLAIRPDGSAQDHASLVLSSSCTPDVQECTWMWQKGMFRNLADTTLAIHADDGASQLGALSLSNACSESDTDCTWTLESARISLGADPRTGLYAGHAPADSSQLGLRPLWPCPSDDTHCTWTLKQGVIRSDADPTLAIGAWDPVPGSPARFSASCTASSPNCRWQLTPYRIESEVVAQGMGGPTGFALSPLGGPLTDDSPADVSIGLAPTLGRSLANVECVDSTPSNPACDPGYACWQIPPASPPGAPVNDQCLSECEDNNNPNCRLEIASTDPVAWSAEPAPKARWTVIHLFFADGDFSWSTLMEMEKMGWSGSTQEVNFLALVDTPAVFDTALQHSPLYRGGGTYLRINRNAAPTVLKELGEIDMGDPEVLADVVQFAATYFPADHYAVEFYDHGSGWGGCCGDADGGDGQQGLGPLNIAYGSTDGGPWGAHGQTLALMNEAIGGSKLSLVFFFACLMGSWEVGEATSPFAQYMVGSEQESSPSLRYQEVYRQLIGEPTMTPAQLASSLAITYPWNDADDPHYWTTMAAYDLASPTIFGEGGALSRAIDDLAMAIQDPVTFECVEAARQAATGFPSNDPAVERRDLYDLADRIGTACADYGITPLTTAVKQAVGDGTPHAVIARNNPPDREDPHGMTVIIPSRCTRVWPEYYNGPGSYWAQTTHWGDFVRAFSPPMEDRAPDGSPMPPTAVTVTSGANLSATLDWTASPTRGVYYTVARGTSPGVYPTIISTGPTATATTVTDSGLDSGTRYYYAVTATNCGTSDAAPEVSIGPPNVSIVVPADNAQFPAPANIPIVASATAVDPGSQITKVEFYRGDTLLRTDRFPPYAHTWFGAPAGSYVLTAKAYDNRGFVATSAPITVNVGGSSDPCSGLCSPWAVKPGPGIQEGYLGTAAVCHETTANVSGGNCGNMTGRTLKVNGTTMTCNGQTWSSLPPKRNNGYCIQVTAGGYAYAYYTTW